MRRRPIDVRDLERIDAFIEARFPDWVPSPITEILWVKRFRGHLGARVLLFDGGPCMLIVEGKPGHAGKDRWVYRGLPKGIDTRPFFFHRMRCVWMRTDGSKDEAAVRHRWNLA